MNNFDNDVKLTLNEVIKETRVSRKTIYRWRKIGNLNFPKPIKIERKLLWYKSEIQQFLKSKQITDS